jgi:hypothetical protein
MEDKFGTWLRVGPSTNRGGGSSGRQSGGTGRRFLQNPRALLQITILRTIMAELTEVE